MRVRRSILFGKKGTADRGCHSEIVKVLPRNDGALNPLWFPSAPEIEGEHMVGDQTREDLIAVSEVKVVEVGQREGGVVARCAPDLDQFFRPFNAGQRFQEHRLDPSEDGRVGANAQRQRDHDRKREAWPLQERPQAVPNILPEGFHELPTKVKAAYPNCRSVSRSLIYRTKDFQNG